MIELQGCTSQVEERWLKPVAVFKCVWVLGMPVLMAEAYLENNIGVVKLIQGELNEGALNMATAAKMQPEVPAFAYNVNLLNEMADSWYQFPQSVNRCQLLQEFMGHFFT